MGAARDFDRDYAEHTGRGDWEAHAFRLRLAVFMEPNGDRDAIDAAGRRRGHWSARQGAGWIHDPKEGNV